MDRRATEDETENEPANDNEHQCRKRRRESVNDEEGPHRHRPTMEEIQKLLTCPISHGIMHDPVTLEKSGHVFDRESLCKSLVENPTECPLTNTDYGEKLYYADCISIRKLLTFYLGDKAYQRFDDSSFRKEYDAISIERLVEPDASTLFTLGGRYRRADGVEQDFLRAVLFYELAAGRGHAQAQYYLGVMHKHGYGVEQNFTQAIYYYEQAAEQGHAKAQCNLGFIYANGRGVEQDYKQAIYYYKQANLITRTDDQPMPHRLG